MSLSVSLVILALLAQVALTLTIYIVLYRSRAAAMRSGEAKLSDYVVPKDEPRHVARVSRSLASQYELPVLFFALNLVILAVGTPLLIDAILAWAFVISRICHAYVHITQEDVRLRAMLFGCGIVIIMLSAIRVAVLASL